MGSFVSLELKEDIEGTPLQISHTNSLHHNPSQQTHEKCAIVESHLETKYQTLNDKNNSLDLNTLIMRSLETLDQVLTLKENTLMPFWNQHSKDIASKLLSPIKTDYVASDIISLRKSLSTPMGQSWFSITKKQPRKKNSSTISFPSSLVSLLESTVSGVITSKKHSKNSKKKLTNMIDGMKIHFPDINSDSNEQKLKTMTFRLFPDTNQEVMLNKMFSQYRWYYNFAVQTWIQHDISPLSSNKFRDEMYTYIDDNNTSLKRNDDNKSVYVPEYWREEKIHNRIPRSAFYWFSSMWKSANSNQIAGHNNGFTMRMLSKKNDHILTFEDANFPKSLLKIKSRYGYRTKHSNEKRRRSIDVNSVIKDTQLRGCTFRYEVLTGRYFLHYPVPIDYFPMEDHRTENQGRRRSSTGKMISLDPGVRKFMVGYCPEDASLDVIGDEGKHTLIPLLLEIDAEENGSDRKRELWSKVKNYVRELHWKTIKYLTDHYDTIIVGDINCSSIMRSKKITRMTKRILQQFSMYSFKSKLVWKCNHLGVKVLLTDECYTSKTCCRCGVLNNVGGSEWYKCVDCGIGVDRDVNGAMNILNKSLTLIEGWSGCI